MLIIYGPEIIVDIGFDPGFDFRDGSMPVDLVAQGLPALIDTGASDSCIDNDLAIELNLPIVDQRVASGSAGKHKINLYLAQIHIPSIPRTLWGRFGGVHLSAGGQLHSALLGRTFLQHFKLIYDGRTGAVDLETP
jgi:predicted aspartyl protease